MPRTFRHILFESRIVIMGNDYVELDLPGFSDGNTRRLAMTGAVVQDVFA
jgi:hypothetical protein